MKTVGKNGGFDEIAMEKAFNAKGLGTEVVERVGG